MLLGAAAMIFLLAASPGMNTPLLYHQIDKLGFDRPFIGMLALMLMFAILLWRCLHVSEVARDRLGQSLAIGITGMLFFQAFVNIGMNIGLMPVTGITLPFVSSGLSSLWTFLIAEGILQSILIRQRKLAFQPD